ncbi:MAG: tRNA lysidine(34) synthetase TilS [Chloroflexi bacterium]|nr:tRNA lysidine(34) synthetase TilS [Chloroflexota bacterium]
MEQTVAGFLRLHSYSGRSAKLVIGVSGGPDSTALLGALAALREPLELDLHVVHINHGLRGKDAVGDQRYVANLCRRWGIPFSGVKADVDAMRKGPRRPSLEEAARSVRYGAFADAARRLAAEAVMVAHNRDDQVETILLNLMRGSGVQGLGGMRPISPLPAIAVGESPPARVVLLRPLLDQPRSAIDAYITFRRLRPRLDPSNLSRDHMRNRVRHELVPLLNDIRRGSEGSIARFGEIALSMVASLDRRIDGAWVVAATEDHQPDGKTVIRIDANRLRDALPSESEQTSFLQRAVDRVVGTRQGFSARNFRAMARLLETATGRLSLPHGLTMAATGRGGIVLTNGSGRSPLPSLLPTPIRPAGDTVAGGWRFTCTPVWDGSVSLRAFADSRGALRLENALPGPLSTVIPLTEADEVHLAVRGRLPGDRIQLGIGTKKLQDLFTDAHIPREWRDEVPIVHESLSGRIVWVVGLATAQPKSAAGLPQTPPGLRGRPETR